MTRSTDPTTDEWLERCAALVPALYRSVSRRVGGDRALAEDLTQEAWLRAIDAWRRRGVPEDPGAWLRTAAFNLARNHYRRMPTPGALEEEPVERADDGSAGRVALVQWGLARMSARDAELLSARHLDGRSLAELARERGASERAIEGRLRRARAALGALLERRAPGAPELLDEGELP